MDADPATADNPRDALFGRMMKQSRVKPRVVTLKQRIAASYARLAIEIGTMQKYG